MDVLVHVQRKLAKLMKVVRNTPVVFEKDVAAESHRSSDLFVHGEWINGVVDPAVGVLTHCPIGKLGKA